MDINNLISQPKACLQQELIDQSIERGNQSIRSLPKFQIQDYSNDQNIKVGKKFQYKLLKSHMQSKICIAFAFNKQGNILVVACRKTIIICFNGYIGKVLQKLTNHTNDVLCLYFMKNSNSFVSGDDDNLIIIWEFDKFSKWSINIQLKDHKKSILCILMNKSEDLLISGSYDYSVKFWRKIDNKQSCQQTIGLKDYSSSLSLNEREEKLISCGNKPFIYVMQMKQDKTWSIIQSIEVYEEGNRLCFINDNQFIFQPCTRNFIEMYYFDSELSLFKKHENSIQVQSCAILDFFFPIIFIKDLKILIVKHGQSLYVFKVQYDDDMKLIQTIDLQDEAHGNLTDDGKYLVTWDLKSKGIQTRQLRYLE